ncbi:MAG: hypothetical protein ACQEWG_07565 [Bacteroidota bacterium]
MKEKKPKFPGNVIDIRFSGNQVYILKEINLTSLDVEEQLKLIKYSGQGRVKSETTENNKFPPFALIFFKLLFRNQRIPEEKELIDFYQECFFTKNDSGEKFCSYKGKSFKVDIEAFVGRLLRTYPSLIRDYHFFLKCTESNYFDKVVYSLKQDYFEGIDITVTSEEIVKHVSLHTKTNRGKFYKDKKNTRHNYKNKNEIIIEIDLQKSKKVSDFNLYPDESLGELIQKVEEEKIEYLLT